MSFKKKSFILLKFRIKEKLLWKDDIIVSTKLPCRININPVLKDDNIVCTDLTFIMEFSENNNNEFYRAIATDYINDLITIYKCFKNYNVKSATLIDVTPYCICYLDQDGNYIKDICSSAFEVIIGSSSAVSYVPDFIKNILLIKNNTLPIWLVSLNESKYYLTLNFYADAIIHANIALENFIYTHIYDRLSCKLSRKKIDSLLRNEDNSKPQTIFKIFKNMTKIVPIKSIDKKKLLSSIKNINDNIIKAIDKKGPIALVENIHNYRNDIVHGNNNQLNLTREHAVCSIQSLEVLIYLCLNTSIENFIKNKYKFTNEPKTCKDLKALDLNSIKINPFCDLPNF